MSTSPTASPPAADDALVPPGSWRVSEASQIGFTGLAVGAHVKITLLVVAVSDDLTALA
jgi:hypothetical protein